MFKVGSLLPGHTVVSLQISPSKIILTFEESDDKRSILPYHKYSIVSEQTRLWALKIFELI